MKIKTTILEFVVIAPQHELETVGEKLKLTEFGEYCPDNSFRSYELYELLAKPQFYRPWKLVKNGKEQFFVLPATIENQFLPNAEYSSNMAIAEYAEHVTSKAAEIRDSFFNPTFKDHSRKFQLHESVRAADICVDNILKELNFLKEIPMFTSIVNHKCTFYKDVKIRLKSM